MPTYLSIAWDIHANIFIYRMGIYMRIIRNRILLNNRFYPLYSTFSSTLLCDQVPLNCDLDFYWPSLLLMSSQFYVTNCKMIIKIIILWYNYNSCNNYIMCCQEANSIFIYFLHPRLERRSFPRRDVISLYSMIQCLCWKLKRNEMKWSEVKWNRKQKLFCENRKLFKSHIYILDTWILNSSYKNCL